jgi:protein required for attachment to host cells
MKPIRTWILIADGARARVVANSGPGRGIQSVEEFDFRIESQPTSELGTDKQGRTFSSAGPGNRALASTDDAHDRQERDFQRLVADFLHDQLQKDSYDRLIIASSPRSLGVLRGLLSKEVHDKIYAEVAKDLTQEKTEDLASHFADVLNA